MAETRRHRVFLLKRKVRKDAKVYYTLCFEKIFSVSPCLCVQKKSPLRLCVSAFRKRTVKQWHPSSKP